LENITATFETRSSQNGANAPGETDKAQKKLTDLRFDRKSVEEAGISGEKVRQEIQTLYNVNCSRRTVERIVENLGLSKKGVASVNSQD
jgi:hypothetical protein